MIELRTGIPGHGKTLAMVESLAKLQKRWDTHPEDARPVFIHGIKDLILPHAPMPVRQVQTKGMTGAFIWVPDWDLMPDGSLVIIDEAQGFFPPRSSQSTPPDYVAWLNTHRHKGFDIWITTQQPKYIDSVVRGLVGKHQHYRRMFGGMRAVVYEFDGCNDSLANLKNAVMTYWPYPKKVFQWYKSAEIHTKQSFKLPKWLLLPVIGVVMGIYFIPQAVATLGSGMTGKGLGSHSETKSVTASPVVGTVAALAATSAVPPVAVLAPSLAAPIVPDTPFTRPVVLAAACLASETKCRCYINEGVRVDLADDLCRKAASENVNFANLKL